MSEVIIGIAGLLAAAYLLWPLFHGRRPAGGSFVLAAVLWAAQPAAAAPQEVSIGLLIVAVDVQRDSLRVSEAWRIANPDRPRLLELAVTLPAGAQYLTVHRGLRGPSAVAGGFAGRIIIPRGLTEVVYSYALPAGRQAALTRAFPLPVERMEIVVRGRGVRLQASRGSASAPLLVGGQAVPRWEIRTVRAGEAVTITLRGLPVSRPWLPGAAAAAFAAVLAAGLFAAQRTSAPQRRRVEE